jgi:alpha-beta hydrolase superfamily lysophospholipase
VSPRQLIFGALFVIGAAGCMPPSWGANALLHPSRRALTRRPDRPFDAVTFDGTGVKLKGWWFHAAAARGTVVVLHGVGDNRGSSVGVADHFLERGFDVIAYDSRAHGESEGNACTYGFYEKQDLGRVLDRVSAKPIVLMGFSMGAAVALQEAAADRRVGAVVAVSSFSDLPTVASERAPFFASRGNIDEAFRLAEAEARFSAAEVSPVAAAPHIVAPTLIIHGERDDETRPAHSLRIFAALHEPKRLILVPGAGHNRVLDADVWRAIDAWLDTALAPRAP